MARSLAADASEIAGDIGDSGDDAFHEKRLETRILVRRLERIAIGPQTPARSSPTMTANFPSSAMSWGKSAW
jgi:hypothetical protein